ncbi:SH3 domain-containing protein [Winogradskyella alexanderae]|uniref:SH3 domain-containing protein n=1 Tax=Winogradskyella alexanderae TaxID=2877123 RepID=A0ABS7XQ91_9FLAO|nr:SH3 domain-containing protein [Winogradskyella alexanderae]MCA0131122.1 SH3 domain-containing protein [Winogradskyella alexanderae]
MNFLKQILLVALIICATPTWSQEQAYVIADNGLSIREKPNLNSKKIGKLKYGQSIKIEDDTGEKLVILDNGKTVSGNWVRVKTRTKYGYVFDGYLSKEMSEGIEVDYKGLSLKIKNLKSTDEFKVKSFFDTDTVTVDVELGDTPEGKTLLLKNKDYKRISIFQKFENSISISNEGPHCDLTKWKHYSSDWKPIEQINRGTFEVLSYTTEDWPKFVNISMEELKQEISNYCGSDWMKLVKNAKSINDYPISVSTSRILLKFIITDFDDKVIEKIIAFNIPMGC